MSSADAPRLAERCRNRAMFHVVRGDRYACGASRDGSLVLDQVSAHEVKSTLRCLRIGCSNDYAKADREARR